MKGALDFDGESPDVGGFPRSGSLAYCFHLLFVKTEAREQKDLAVVDLEGCFVHMVEKKNRALHQGGRRHWVALAHNLSSVAGKGVEGEFGGLKCKHRGERKIPLSNPQGSALLKTLSADSRMTEPKRGKRLALMCFSENILVLLWYGKRSVLYCVCGNGALDAGAVARNVHKHCSCAGDEPSERLQPCFFEGRESRCFCVRLQPGLGLGATVTGHSED